MFKMIELIARSRAFPFAISKTKVGIQEAILPILSMKSWFQVLPWHRNASRRWRNQKIQGVRCLNSSIARNIQESISCPRERIYNILKLGMTIGSSPWWDQWLWWNPKRRIIMVKLRPLDLHQSIMITPCDCLKRERREISSVWS